MYKFPGWFLFFIFFAENIALADVPDAVREAGDIYLKSHNHEMTEEPARLVDPEKERNIAWAYELFAPNPFGSEPLKITYRTRQVLVQVLSTQIRQASQPVKTSANILQDTRVLGNEEPGKSSMLDTLFPGYTLSGEVLKALILAQPTSDIKALRHQQALIKKTMQTESLQNRLPAILKQLKDYEPTVVSLFDNADIIYFPEIRERTEKFRNPTWTTKAYNLLFNSLFWVYMNGTNLVLMASMVSMAAEPFLNERYCSCSFFTGIAYSVFSLGIMSAKQLFDHFVLDKLIESQQIALYKTIRVRVDILSYYLRQALSLQQLTDLPEELRLSFTSQEMTLIKHFLYGTEWLIEQDPRAKTNYLEYAIEMLSHSLELKQAIAKALYQSGKIDIYQAIARRMNSPAASGQLTFAQFTAQKPLIVARGLWNPVLNADKVVTNDIVLEKSDTSPARRENWPYVYGTCSAHSELPLGNLLLSGCNASGKSTMMRAITVNSIYLAQTFGIAAAESFQTGLFHAIYSHMDKYDHTGEFSSYEGELMQARQLIEQASSLESDQNMLACFDELFSNTDPEASLYVTNKVLNLMARQLRTINIVSSHYDVDTVGVNDENEFARMHMHVEKVNGTLVKTYQLRQGQNKQSNALFHLMEKFRSFPDIYSELERLRKVDNNG